MQVTKEMMDMLLHFENIIGNSCYNPDSYDGWTGEYGKYFRYGLTYKVPVEDGFAWEKSKYAYTIEENVTPENFAETYYKFGANELLIGEAIVKVLDMLEKRYGLDFNELEKQHRESET